MAKEFDIEEIYNYRPWSGKPWGVTVELSFSKYFRPLNLVVWNHIRDSDLPFSRENLEDAESGVLSLSAAAGTYEEAKELGKLCAEQVSGLCADWVGRAEKIRSLVGTEASQSSKVPPFTMAI